MLPQVSQILLADGLAIPYLSRWKISYNRVDLVTRDLSDETPQSETISIVATAYMVNVQHKSSTKIRISSTDIDMSKEKVTPLDCPLLDLVS